MSTETAIKACTNEAVHTHHEWSNVHGIWACPGRPVLPQDRVLEFLESHDRWEGEDADYITSTGQYNSPYSVMLCKTDVRDMLNELTDHQKFIVEIDEVLDSWDEPLIKLRKIAKLFGNHHIS